jgi:hypothetical protein
MLAMSRKLLKLCLASQPAIFILYQAGDVLQNLLAERQKILFLLHLTILKHSIYV